MIESIAATSNAPKWAAVRLLVSPTLGINGTRMPSAALVSRLSPKPCAIAASERIEQGTTIIPSVRKEPLAIGAARLSGACT